ncbi:putative sugar nucleotidyl transferase [Planctomycetota bacterium]
MRTVLFEDPYVSELDPLALARPAYLLSCGGSTLFAGLQQVTGISSAIVRPHLKAVELSDRAFSNESVSERDGLTLLVNARLVPSVGTFRTLAELLRRKTPCVVSTEHGIAVAVLPETVKVPDDLSTLEGYYLLRDRIAMYDIPEEEFELSMLTHAHDIVSEHLLNFDDTLEKRIASGNYHQLSDGVFVVDPNTVIDPLVRCETSKGPILIEENVTIGPFTLLRGPLHIGANSIVNEHAALKENVWIGNNCKVGGEVEESTIEPFSNKQHHGFMGHSYIGSWVNLGAGTSNSDLKNTYGEIRIDYDSGRCNTGMQFLGCMIGDYTKSAINTSIFTGKVIGACSMLYGFITTNVPSFANYARTFGQVTELPDSVLIDTQRRMFTRRRITQRQIDIQLIHDMYELVRKKRQLVEERLAL